ncbi:MAG: glycosyltransferase family 9 protein [Elusimicrobia bacterium]|nr:glycosyltransferase family 9 protein [Elusimicrobiota bacterium]
MNTLLIKLGALGDVVRTTPLLRVLPGKVTWVADRAAHPLLPREPLDALLTLPEASALRGRRFDLVLSLDEDREAAALASSVEAGRLEGTYLGSDGGLRYTDGSAGWFDMSLISRLGRERADSLKRRNGRTYQDLVFAMLGRRFSGEEYWIAPAARRREPGRPLRVGLDGRAGPRWPMKRWGGFPALARRLEADGLRVQLFRQRARLQDFRADIAACDLVVCGDTLTMHLALALGIRTVALFLCTSPYEIHGYGRLVKVASPLWKDYAYARGRGREPGEALGVAEVHAQVRRLCARTAPAACP